MRRGTQQLGRNFVDRTTKSLEFYLRHVNSKS